MITITQSVGRGGRAKRGSDVRKIQKLLNKANANKADAKPKLVPDGSVGTKTIRAIERFQSSFMKKPDGRIDPDGNSLRRLNTKALETAIAAATQISFMVSGTELKEEYHFHEFNYRRGGGRKAVLRDGRGYPRSSSLRNWYDSTNKGNFKQLTTITVSWEYESIIREIEFFEVMPVSLTTFGPKVKKLTFAFSTFRGRTRSSHR